MEAKRDAFSGSAYLLLVAVACLWGATNPFIKRGCAGMDALKGSTHLGTIMRQSWYMATRLNFLIPFALNQCGSAVYVSILPQLPVSVAVPVINSLTLVVSLLVACLLGEPWPTARECGGLALIVAGVCVCVLSG